MRVGVPWNADSFSSMPMYGDAYIPRPIGTVRRMSAPPRPPRPDFGPQGKGIMVENVIEIEGDAYASGNAFHPDLHHPDGSVDIRVSAYDFQTDPVAGRISPVSPLSEETASSAGFNSNHVSPSNSFKKTAFLDEPRLRRPFSFESLRSANSGLSHVPGMKPEQLQVPYKPAQIYDEYAEIAMSNPYQSQLGLHQQYLLHAQLAPSQQQQQQQMNVRPHDYQQQYTDEYSLRQSPHHHHHHQQQQQQQQQQAHFQQQELQYQAQAQSQQQQQQMQMTHQHMQQGYYYPESAYKNGIEPSRRSSQTRNSGYSTPSSVLMSKFNPMAPPSPRPDPHEAQRQLDAAWEEVKRAVAPKLRVAIPDDELAHSPRNSAESLKPSTSHALPPSPPPPPVPLRNPRRAKGPEPQELDGEAVVSAEKRRSLLHYSSSPTLAKSYLGSLHEPLLPPMPVMPTQPPVPRPVSKMPVQSPTGLPTPTLSECSSDRYSFGSPMTHSSSMHRADSCFSNSGFVSVPSPVTEPSPPPMPAFHVSEHKHQALANNDFNSPPPSSPTGRGFHEPPPVAPPIHSPPPKRFSSIASPPPNQHLRGWSDSRVGVTTAIWAGPAPPVSYRDVQAKVNRTNTLRSVAPGESAARASYQQPVQAPVPIESSRLTQETVVQGTNGNHVLHGSQKSIDAIAPVKVIPLTEKQQKKVKPGENMPRFSNNFAGFCKGAWRLQTGQNNKTFTLRTTNRKTVLPNSTTMVTKTTTLRCNKCSFEGPLARHPATLAGAADYGVTIDYLACAEKTPRTAHGVVYRWSFLFKSHLSCRTTLRKDEIVDLENEVYGCLFCCSEGKGTVCFKGAKSLCGHIAKEHAEGIDLDKELKQRLGIVVARQPAKGEEWDIILPGRVWF